MRTRKPARFAERTTVSVETSRAELEKLLERHGATHFGVYREPEGSKVVFKIGDRFVRQSIVYPVSTKKAPIDNVDREWRRRWRASVLITKAKLELIAAGDSTFDREFLADTLLADGLTVYEATSKQIAESYSTGVAPRFLLGSGGA